MNELVDSKADRQEVEDINTRLTEIDNKLEELSKAPPKSGPINSPPVVQQDPNENYFRENACPLNSSNVSFNEN